LEVELGGSRRGHDIVSVQEESRVSVASNDERPVERRGQTEGDFDLLGIDERG